MKFIVLMYHAIAESLHSEEKKFACTPSNFRKQMNYLKTAGYHIVSLHEIVDVYEKGKELPEKSVAITFDDGYIDMYENAFPVLKELGYPATLFVVSGLCWEAKMFGIRIAWIHQEENFVIGTT